MRCVMTAAAGTAGVTVRPACAGCRPGRATREAPGRRASIARAPRAAASEAAVEPGDANAKATMNPAAGEYSRSFTLELNRPMGMVLNSGRKGIGAFVAELVPGGSADVDGTVRVNDVLLSVGPDGLDVTNMDFDDIMDALGRNPDEPTMPLTMKRYADTPNKSKPIGYVWLEANASKEGVVVLPSGLQYKVLKSGKGKASIKTDTPCSCHYEGTLLDGE